jgi:hypothetical protein
MHTQSSSDQYSGNPLSNPKYRYECYTHHPWNRPDYYVVMDTWTRNWLSDDGRRIEFATYADARAAITRELAR